MAKKQLGAPRKPQDQKLDVIIPVRLTAKEKVEVDAAAVAAMDKTSPWARKILVQAARRQQKNNGK